MSIYCKVHIKQLSNGYRESLVREFIRISCSQLFGYTQELETDIYNTIWYDKLIDDISIVQGKLRVGNDIGEYISTSMLKKVDVIHGKYSTYYEWMHKGIIGGSASYWSVREIFEDKDQFPYDDLGKRRAIVAKLCFNYIEQVLGNPIIAYCMPYNPQF